MPLRTGIIGAGRVFPNHIIPLKKLDDVEVTAVCDREYARARDRAAEFDIPHMYTDWRELLAGPVDAVFILTPPALHAEHAIAALEAGKHVFCEKPLAQNLDDGRAIVEAAEAAGVVCQIGFNNMFEPEYRLMYNLYKNGELGRLVHAYDKQWVLRPAESWLNRNDTWRLNQQASGGRMQEFGSHKVAWLTAVGGNITGLTGRYDTIAETLIDTGVDDTTLMMMDFAGGGVGTVEVSLSPTAQTRRIVGILGTEASVEWHGDHHVYLQRKGHDHPEKITPPHLEESRQGHFVRCALERHSEPEDHTTAEFSYHILEICLAFLESAENRSFVAIQTP